MHFDAMIGLPINNFFNVGRSIRVDDPYPGAANSSRFDLERCDLDSWKKKIPFKVRPLRNVNNLLGDDIRSACTMNPTFHTENGVVILTFTEPLLNANAVNEAVAVINTGESWNVILDCQAIQSLVGDSLSNLLNLNKQLTEEGGRLVLCNVAPDFAEVLRVTRFDRILRIRSNVESAVACIDDLAISIQSKLS